MQLVTLSYIDIKPETSIRVLGLYIDTKLRYGLYIAQVQAKVATQDRAIKFLAGSTWGAAFLKC